MEKSKTKEEILDKNGFDFDAFKFENEYSAKNLLIAMDEYSEQNCSLIHELFNRPTEKLKPLADLYRKENPLPSGNFYIPDRTKFYEWITNKIITNDNKSNF